MRKREFGRRELIKRFGALAFVLSPVAKAMGYVAGGSFANAPRFVMFFRGASYQSPSIRPSELSGLAGGPMAPLLEHERDIILFRNMHIHGGSPKTTGYQEEHAAGLYGCTTGNRIHYSRNDSYYAYTDYESIDIAIANHYQTRPELAALPISSLHIGAGAHSDADNVGLGQRYISFRNRQSGDSQYGNAVEPIQNAGRVYDMLMTRITSICSADSMQPGADQEQLRATLLRRRSMLDFRIRDIEDAKRALGMDSEHARRFDGMLEYWREIERTTTTELERLDREPSGGTAMCPSGTRPTGDGDGQQNLDNLSPVHDQMIDLIRLAFEWDLTRVVAFTLSGASCGQRSPNRGVSTPHHSLEHAGNTAQLNTVDLHYSEKFSRLLSALKSIDDGDGQNALFNSSVILGMECWSDGGHYLTNIPFVLAGNGGGAWQSGRIVDAAGRSNNDLLISVQKAAGIDSDTFGLASLCRGPIV